jgi:inner membrane protein
MDPITHGLAGAAISYAFFGRRLGRHAAALGALAGMAPDIDHFVSSESDPLLYVQVHRSFTHSLLFAILGSLLSTIPWVMRKRFQPEWARLWACAFPAYLSHCFIDASTTYGTQLLWPFTHHRFGWNLIAVIDPLFTLILAVGLWLSVAKRNFKIVKAGLALCCGLLAIGGIQNLRATHVQSMLAQQRGHATERQEVMPTLGNNLVWRSLYLTNGKLYSDRIRVGWFSSPTFREGTSLPLVTAENLRPIEIEGDRKNRAFQRFAWFSDNWVARSPFDETVIGDMRYSISTKAFDPVWGIRFTHHGEDVAVEWVNRQLERKASPAELWSEITGSQPDYKPVINN